MEGELPIIVGRFCSDLTKDVRVIVFAWGFPCKLRKHPTVNDSVIGIVTACVDDNVVPIIGSGNRHARDRHLHLGGVVFRDGDPGS